jgi:alkylation response protein AidB-like acyl-CoA dehydrogenase
MMRNADALLAKTHEIAAALAKERGARQLRRQLDPRDFQRLRDIGLHLISVPVAYGGMWEDLRHSVRPLCETLRILAHGDSSLALVFSMHPSVLSFWRDSQPPAASAPAWETQRRKVFEAAGEGAWWGTITSEPGSGGDVANTKTVAQPENGTSLAYRLTGQKHFGSGSGVTSYMLTTALPAGEQQPDWFFLDVRDVPWDGSSGMKLVAEWDGHGMASTNSHAFSFRDFPATRIAWPGHWRDVLEANGGSVSLSFTAVVVGITEAAMAFMRQELRKRGNPAATLRAYEKIEWVSAEQEAWLIGHAYEGALQSIERKGRARHDTLMAKTNIARLAESLLTRLCRISGGGVFARHSPLGFWFEDVRALGFLRPPWGLAFDGLFELSWQGLTASQTETA